MAQTESIVPLLTSVTKYGGQLAAVIHNYALTCDPIQMWFEGSLNIVDTTVVTLKQVLELVKDHVENGKVLFSQQGLEFAHLLAVECGNTLLKIETQTANGCLSSEERKALRRSEVDKTPPVVPVTDLIHMSLDEKSFLKTMENGARAWKRSEILGCIARLHDLQLHLLLIYQVVTVGALSKDVTSGKVDIQSIVSCHNRIKRTASLVGIETPGEKRRRQSFTDSDYTSSTSDSDSYGDGSSIKSRSSRRRISKSRYGRDCRPPPPPAAYPPAAPLPRLFGPPSAPSLPWPPNPPGPPGPPLPPQSFQYKLATAERPQAVPIAPFQCIPPPPPTAGAFIPHSGPGQCAGYPLVAPCDQASSQQVKPPAYVDRPNLNLNEKDTKEEAAIEAKGPVKPAIHEARLFKTQPKGFVFKLKSLFRSKESLAEEMKRALSDSESRLIAYVIHGCVHREIPHSAFHSLEATHMKTILSQLQDNSWYETFVRLRSHENIQLNTILHHMTEGKYQDREVVVLKFLDDRKYAAESKPFGWLPRIQLSPGRSDYRTILAIVRERLVDGKPLLQDLPSHLIPRPPVRIATGLLNEVERNRQRQEGREFTFYAEYTLRFRDHHANGARPLAPIVERVHNDQVVIQQRVDAFERQGGNVIGVTLLLTERQSEQVNILMREIRVVERDTRFEWTWAEISLYNGQGEITNFHPRGAGNIAGTAHLMHLVAKRTLKSTVRSPPITPCGPAVCFTPGPPPATLTVPPQFNAPGAPFRPGPAGPPGPPGPPLGPPLGHPPCPPGPPGFGPGPLMGPWSPPKPEIVINTRPPPGLKPGSIRSISLDSDDSALGDGDSSDSETSIRMGVRWGLRKAKKYQIKRRQERAKRRAEPDYSSYNDSDSETSDDGFTFDLPLKHGDDAVTKLLEMWTPPGSIKEPESA